MIKYSYESTSLHKLLQMISEKMKGRLALSIALIMDGRPEAIKICSQKVNCLRVTIYHVYDTCISI